MRSSNNGIPRLILFSLGLVFLCLLILSAQAAKEVEEDDFAEFDDDFDEDELARGRGRRSQSPPPVLKTPPQGQQQQEEEKQRPDTVESQDDDDFDEIDDTVNQEGPPLSQEASQKFGFEDEDEAEVEEDDFEGIDEDDFEDDEREGKRKDMPPPKLTITSVPMPARGWQAYWAETLMMAGIIVYMLNYVMGRYKNQKIAQSFFDINWNILEENFTLLGDSTILEDDQGTRNYQRMSDSIYQMWCSGRVCCEGMLLELKLLKRQDLVSVLANIFRPAKDVLRVSVEMGKEDMDNFVCAVASKKTGVKISKEYNDLANYCPDKKSGDKYGLPAQFVVMTEMGEVASSIFDSRTVSVINKFAPLIDCIHITDQFTGLKNTEPDSGKDLKSPEPRRFLFFTLNLLTTASGNNAEQVFEDMKPFFQFIFYTIDRMKRLRLSREGKMKAEKNRAKIEEAYMKLTHVARAEAAAARKEEKRRQEKERILQEDDPEKQRRWEEKEQKREKKKKTPKMKQLKVKAM